MENIAAAVRGGPFAFVSGIRGTVLPRTGERVIEETPEAFARQTDVSNEIIKAIFAECGLGPDALLRVDTFLRDGSRAAEAAAIHRRVLGHDPVAATTVALPLSARGEIEITTLAAAKGVRKETHAATRNEPTTVSAGGFVFVGECEGLPPADSAERAVLLGNAPAQLEHALRMLDRGLQRAECIACEPRADRALPARHLQGGRAVAGVAPASARGATHAHRDRRRARRLPRSEAQRDRDRW
jgi:enamine deaminase RidA (YjgF/YER057c/UK114 family)